MVQFKGGGQKEEEVERGGDSRHLSSWARALSHFQTAHFCHWQINLIDADRDRTKELPHSIDKENS